MAFCGEPSPSRSSIRVGERLRFTGKAGDGRLKMFRVSLNTDERRPSPEGYYAG